MAITKVEKLFLTKHLGVMIKAGVSLPEALETVKEQAGPALKKVIRRIEIDVDNGTSLSDAMSKHKKTFDEFFTSLIRAGEKSGTLDENLSFLAEQIERDYSLRKKITGALLYPGLVIGASLIAGTLMAWYVLPKLADLFLSFEIELPLSTRVLLWIAGVMESYGGWITGSMVGLIVLIIFMLRVRAVRSITDSWLLKTPFVGKMVVDAEVGRMCRNLGTLLKAGLPVTEALDITADTIGNLRIKDDLLEVKSSISKGKSLFETLNLKKYSGEFPLIAVRMVAVGEKSGNLSEMLLYLGDFFESEVDNVSKRLGDLLEPVLLLIIGFMVAFVALSIISPIYSLIGGIGG